MDKYLLRSKDLNSCPFKSVLLMNSVTIMPLSSCLYHEMPCEIYLLTFLEIESARQWWVGGEGGREGGEGEISSEAVNFTGSSIDKQWYVSLK